MTTVFARILRGEIQCQKVYEDEHVLAFHDIQPVAPIHILIIPKKAIVNCLEMKEEDAPLVGHILWVAKKIASDLKLEHCRFVMNNGAEAGQSVFHMHLHLLAGRSFAWPPG